MKYLNVSISFIKEKTPSEKVTYGTDRKNDIVLAVATFATPDPDEPAMDDANTDLTTAITNADGGSDAQKDTLKHMVINWDDVFRKEAKYVEGISNKAATIEDAIDIVNLSGFQYNKIDRSPLALPDQPTINARQLAEAGTIEVFGDKPENTINMITVVSPTLEIGAHIVNTQISFTEGAQIILVNHTRGNHKVINLVSGQRYYIIRWAFNANGASPASQRISIIAP